MFAMMVKGVVKGSVNNSPQPAIMGWPPVYLGKYTAVVVTSCESQFINNCGERRRDFLNGNIGKVRAVKQLTF